MKRKTWKRRSVRRMGTNSQTSSAAMFPIRRTASGETAHVGNPDRAAAVAPARANNTAAVRSGRPIARSSGGPIGLWRVQSVQKGQGRLTRPCRPPRAGVQGAGNSEADNLRRAGRSARFPLSVEQRGQDDGDRRYKRQRGKTQDVDGPERCHAVEDRRRLDIPENARQHEHVEADRRRDEADFRLRPPPGCRTRPEPSADPPPADTRSRPRPQRALPGSRPRDRNTGIVSSSIDRLSKTQPSAIWISRITTIAMIGLRSLPVTNSFRPSVSPPILTKLEKTNAPISTMTRVADIRAASTSASRISTQPSRRRPIRAADSGTLRQDRHRLEIAQNRPGNAPALGSGEAVG